MTDIIKKSGGGEIRKKYHTPLLPLSGSRKVARTPTNLTEQAATAEVHVPKDIIARRIQVIYREQCQYLSLNFFPGGYRRRRRLSVLL